MAVDVWHHHLRQAGCFLLAGAAQLALDSSIFIAATALGAPVIAGNLIGRASGAALGFWLNGRYTFDKAKLEKRHAVRFFMVWTLLTALSTVLIDLIAAHLGLHSAWLAKPLVEGGVAVIAFFLWKHVVFR
jgi:putative flippase GtrA